MALDQILKPAHSIELVVKNTLSDRDSDKLHLKTMIENNLSNGEISVLAPVYQGNTYPIHPGDSVEVVFHSDDENEGLFSVTCRVKSRFIKENLPILILIFTSEPIKIQRREAFRVKLYDTYTFNWNGFPHTLVTKDMSFTGMLVLTDIKLPVGSAFEIEFDGNTEEPVNLNKIFTLHCKVLESSPELEIRRYRTRILFDGLTQSETKILLQYLYSKQSEILHMNPEYETFIERAFPKDRRVMADPVRVRINSIGLLSMFISFIAFVLLLFAQPKSLYSLDLFFGYYRPAIWQTRYLTLTLIALGIGILTGIVGLILNSTRLKRKNDTLNLGIVISLISNFLMLAIVLYFIVANDLILF